MGLRKDSILILWVLALAADQLLGGRNGVESKVVFKVEHKFGGPHNSNLRDLKAHDASRHARILSSVDLPLGGNRLISDAALYYTKLKIGTPPREYSFFVDSGSDISWTNCAGCEKCATFTSSSLGMKLHPYDIKASSTGKVVNGEDDVCFTKYGDPNYEWKTGKPCEFWVEYSDLSAAGGYYVQDLVSLPQISGDLQTISLNESLVFGCAIRHAGHFGTSFQKTDGLIGLSPTSKASFISQISKSGKVKKIFSHCLDGFKGGGIFTIGEVAEPKFNTTSLIPDETGLFITMMKAIKVDNEVVSLINVDASAGCVNGCPNYVAVIDSGTTLARIPAVIFDQVVQTLFAKHPTLKIQTYDDVLDDPMKCFKYTGDIDDGFPLITLHFEGGLRSNVYPHDYLLPTGEENEWCIGFQRGGPSLSFGEVFLLGDLVLADKLVVYDLENQTIGWTEYNCSSTIAMKDENSGKSYTVGGFNNNGSALYSVVSLTHPKDVNSLLSKVDDTYPEFAVSPVPAPSSSGAPLNLGLKTGNILAFLLLIAMCFVI